MRRFVPRSTAILIAVATLVLAACSAAGSGGPPQDVAPPPDADITVVAEHFAFDTDEIRLTAGDGTVLGFVNRDDDGHNIAIYRDDGGDPLFRGDVIVGEAIAYQVPPLEAGTYRFQCDPHPVMNGTVVVEKASG